MVESSLSLVRFQATNFFAVMINTRPFYPVSTTLIKIVDSLIASEPEPDEKHKLRIDWIRENTHKDINKPIAVVELAVFKNLDKGLHREITLGNKDYLLIDLYKGLEEVTIELARITTEIAKKYSLDISFAPMVQNQKMSFEDLK